MEAEKLRSNLAKGSIARLLPVVSDSKKEERATSVVLASFMVVPEFAHAVLSEAGAPISKTSKVQCLTEVTFKGESSKKSRPDGLIIVSTGRRVWSALVESKVGRNELDCAQVEDYLSIAKINGVDAVITISNQFASLPTHHPVRVNRQKIRSTGLFHFSWLSITSKALLLNEGKAIADKEQAYILKELVRYLEHEGSGVQSAMKMSAGWKQVCDQVHQGIQLNKNGDSVRDAVSSWHQLQRFLAIQLTLAVNNPVTESLRRKHAADAALRLQDDIGEFAGKSNLSSTLVVPNAAGRIDLCADFLRKTLDLSIRVDAPGDTKRQSASINWLARQLKNCNATEVLVRANWPGRIATTSAPAVRLIEEPNLLIPENVKDLPTSFDVVRIIDMGGKFKSVNAFVELSEGSLVTFYKDVCQNLNKWIAKAPKVKKQTDISDQDSSAQIATQALTEVLGKPEDKNATSEDYRETVKQPAPSIQFWR